MVLLNQEWVGVDWRNVSLPTSPGFPIHLVYDQERTLHHSCLTCSIQSLHIFLLPASCILPCEFRMSSRKGSHLEEIRQHEFSPLPLVVCLCDCSHYSLWALGPRISSSWRGLGDITKPALSLLLLFFKLSWNYWADGFFLQSIWIQPLNHSFLPTVIYVCTLILNKWHVKNAQVFFICLTGREITNESLFPLEKSLLHS